MAASTAARRTPGTTLLRSAAVLAQRATRRAAPENLAQSVLPGWNFGTIVNLSDENSAAPQTELAILRNRATAANWGRSSTRCRC